MEIRWGFTVVNQYTVVTKYTVVNQPFPFVRYFVFGLVKIPSDVSNRFQLTLIRSLETEKETFIQVLFFSRR